MALTINVLQPAAQRVRLDFPGEWRLALEQGNATDGDVAGRLSPLPGVRLYHVRSGDELTAEVHDSRADGGWPTRRSLYPRECKKVWRVSQSVGRSSYPVLGANSPYRLRPEEVPERPMLTTRSIGRVIALQAVACFFPPTDFLNYGAPSISGVGEGPMALLRLAFGPRALTEEGRRTLGREISPIYFLTKRLPPTLIIHGDADKDVPLQQSESFVQAARSAGAANVELIVRPGKGHGWGDFWRSTEDVTAFADWFDRHLRDRGD